MESNPGTCADISCVIERPSTNRNVLFGLGWVEVKGRLYCDLHGPAEAYKARREEKKKR